MEAASLGGLDGFVLLVGATPVLVLAGVDSLRVAAAADVFLVLSVPNRRVPQKELVSPQVDVKLSDCLPPVWAWLPSWVWSESVCESAASLNFEGIHERGEG